MNARGVLHFVKALQQALKLIAIIHMTAYLWPQHSDIPDGATFDFIVVGAGTAGSVVANRLTEEPNFNVLLIEAGGDPPIESDFNTLLLFMKNSHYDWNYTTEANPHYEKCHQQSFITTYIGKMLGGTSSLNYMQYFRGLPQDYDSWAQLVKDETWNWKNVLPFFKKAENVEDIAILRSPKDKVLYGTNGYLTINTDHHDDSRGYFESCKEMGYNMVPDLNENHPLGCTGLKVAIGDEERQSTAYSYLRPIKHRPNLKVMKDTYVTKVIFDENKNAIGVEVVTRHGETKIYKAQKEVIVSAGALNSAKILMLSGIGPKTHLQSKNIKVISDLPVGENLQDHVSIDIVQNAEVRDKPIPAINPHEHPARAAVSYFALNKTCNQPDYQVLSFYINEDMYLYFCAFTFNMKHDICDEIRKSGLGRNTTLHQIDIRNSQARGKVTLRSADPADPPVIDSGYLPHEEDLENMLDYLVDFSKIFNTPHSKKINGDMADPTTELCGHLPKYSREFWRCYSTCMVNGNDNYVGTCAMGSVVDSKLKVLGVQRLRVVDGSVMPKITSTRVMGPIIMIGEKAADFIKDDYTLN